MTKKERNQQQTLFKTKPNKAKVKIGKMNVSLETIKDYDKNNKQPTTNVIQNKANFRKNRRSRARCNAVITLAPGIAEMYEDACE